MLPDVQNDETESTPKPIPCYILKDKLGEGTTSAVYEAHHHVHGVCAVKKLNEDYDTEYELDFLEKVQGHPNFIKVYESWKNEGIYHIAMEKLDGTLKDLMDSDPFLQEEIENFAKQMLTALVYLSEKRIVHFDLKPDNIGYTNSSCGRIYKLMDFGISETFDTVESESFKNDIYKREFTKVTLWYRPIEITLIQKKPINEKTDIWSLGCILYEMMCNEVLFGDLDENLSKRYNKKVYTDGITKAKSALHDKQDIISLLIQRCLIVLAKKRIDAQTGLEYFS
jgi:serine/threonine protein kinase